jgi:hypothetical protein
MYCEAGSTEAIQDADELGGSRYSKRHTTKGVGNDPKDGRFAAKNLAFALMTGLRLSARIHNVMEADPASIRQRARIVVATAAVMRPEVMADSGNALAL